MRKCAIIYSFMRRPLVIYDFPPDPFWISLYMRKIFFSFLTMMNSDLFYYQTGLWNRRVKTVHVHRNKVFWKVLKRKGRPCSLSAPISSVLLSTKKYWIITYLFSMTSHNTLTKIIVLYICIYLKTSVHWYPWIFCMGCTTFPPASPV